MPLVYALLPNKEEATYLRLFDLLMPHVIYLLKIIMTDFELGELNSLRKHKALINVVIEGCFFHFAQICGKTCKKNLTISYIHNLDVIQTIKRSSFFKA